MKEIYEKYNKYDFEIVSVGIDGLKKIKSYVKEKEMNWINIHENRKINLSKLYWVKKLPAYFLIDRNGNIVLKDFNIKSEVLLEILDNYLIN